MFQMKISSGVISSIISRLSWGVDLMALVVERPDNLSTLFNIEICDFDVNGPPVYTSSVGKDSRTLGI